MGVPELVVQKTVFLSWKFVKENTYLFGELLEEMDPMKQERYRTLVEQENVSIIFGYPTVKTVLPSFSIVLLGEEEEIAVIGDEGPDSRVMPYPAVAEDDYNPQEEFYGTLYGEDTEPKFSAVDGDLIRESTRHPLPRKNLAVQRAPGDEQFEQIGYPQRLWHRDRQRLSVRTVIDRVNIGIVVTTANEEKTFVYHRLLKNVLRRFIGLFNTNSIQNPKFSSADVVPGEALGPTTGGNYPFQRMMTISFMYEDRIFDIESVIRGWLFEVDLATPGKDGETDLTPVISVTGAAEDD